jgi:Flp pilus assembly protein TadD
MLATLFRHALGRLRTACTVEEVRALIVQRRLDEARAAAARLEPGTPQREFAQACLEGEIAFRQGRDEEARQAFRRVLDASPGYAHAHHGLSLLMYEQGQVEAALRHARFAVSVRPNDELFLAQLGLCHVSLGNYAIAERIVRRALRAMPEDKYCWNNMGIVLVAKGDRQEARRCFTKALEFDPDFAQARANLALLDADAAVAPPAHVPELPALPQAPEVLAPVAPVPRAEDGERTVAESPEPGADWADEWLAVVHLQMQERYEEALDAGERLALRYPEDARLTWCLARLYTVQGDAQGGLDTLRAYLQMHPGEPHALTGLGRALTELGEHKQAEVHLREAVRLAPDDWEAHAALAELLHLDFKYGEASTEILRAIELSPVRHEKLVSQAAATQVMACHYEEAVALYQELFAIRPMAVSPARGGYALCLTYMGRFEEAGEILDELVTRGENDPNIRVQRSQLRLLLGDFAGGWDDYLYRGLADTQYFRVLPFPCWRGEPLEGKSIVVLAEQGLGDQVMFASCLPDLLALGPAKVHVEALKRVAPTLARSFPDCTVIATDQSTKLDWVPQVGAADFYVPLADLPAYFRRSVGEFPRTPYLKADPARVANWAARLRDSGPGPYIGLSWRGGVELTRKVLRSFSPATFQPIVRDIPATWVNLQYGDVAADLDAAAAAGLSVLNWPEAIKDLDEFAALVTALDAVVTVCNTTVHYAGGVGSKVWVLAPHIPEWRYGYGWEAMPWYRDVTVLRQQQPGDWAWPVAEVGRRLAGWLETRGN